jgi:hypothetical protein
MPTAIVSILHAINARQYFLESVMDVFSFLLLMCHHRIMPFPCPQEANCTLPMNSGIAAAAASWHNSEALADLRHGTFLRPVLNGSHAFSGKHLCPHGQPAAE